MANNEYLIPTSYNELISFVQQIAFRYPRLVTLMTPQNIQLTAEWIMQKCSLSKQASEEEWGRKEAELRKCIINNVLSVFGQAAENGAPPNHSNSPFARFSRTDIERWQIGLFTPLFHSLYVDLIRTDATYNASRLTISEYLNDVNFREDNAQSDWKIIEYNSSWYLAQKEGAKWRITQKLEINANNYHPFVTDSSGKRLDNKFKPSPFIEEEIVNPEEITGRTRTRTDNRTQEEKDREQLERIARHSIILPNARPMQQPLGGMSPSEFIKKWGKVQGRYGKAVDALTGRTMYDSGVQGRVIRSYASQLPSLAAQRSAFVAAARQYTGLGARPGDVPPGWFATRPTFSSVPLTTALNFTFNPLSAPTSSLLSPTLPGTSGSFLGSSFSLAGSSSYFSISPTGTGGLGITSGLGGGVAKQDGIGTPSVPIGNGPVPLPEPAASSGGGGSKPPITTTTAAPSPDDDSYKPNSGFSPEGLLGKGVDVSSLDSILDGLPESKPNEPVSPNKPDKQNDPLEIALEKALKESLFDDAIKGGEVFWKYANGVSGIETDVDFWDKAHEAAKWLLKKYWRLDKDSDWHTKKSYISKADKIQLLFNRAVARLKALGAWKEEEYEDEYDDDESSPAEAEVARDTEALTEAMKDAEKSVNNSKPISDSGAPLEEVSPGLYWSNEEKKFYLPEEIQSGINILRRRPNFRKLRNEIVDIAEKKGDIGRFTLGLYKKYPEVLDYASVLAYLGKSVSEARGHQEGGLLGYPGVPSEETKSRIKPYYGGVFDIAFERALFSMIDSTDASELAFKFLNFKQTPDERFGINVKEVSEDTAKDIKKRTDNTNNQEGRYGYANIISRLVKLGFLSLGESGLDLAEKGRKAIDVYKTTYPEIDYDNEVSLQKKHYRDVASTLGRSMRDDDVVFGFLEPYLQLQPALLNAVYSSYKDKDQNQAVLSPRSLMMNANEVASLYQDIKYFGKDGTLSADWIDKILAIEEQDPNSLKNTTISPLTDTQAIEPLTVPQEVDSSTMKPYDGMDYKDNLFWDYIMNHVSMETRKDAYRDQLFGEISGISHKGFGNYHVWDVQGRGGIKEANEYVEQALQEGRFKDIYEETVKANPWIEKLMPESTNLNLDKYKTEYARFFAPILSSLIYFQTASIKHPEGRNIKGEVIKSAEDYSETERKTRIEYLRSLAKDGAHWAMLAEPRGKGIGADDRVTSGLEKLREERSRRLIEEAQKEVTADISNSTVPVSATETEAPSQSPIDIAVNTTAPEAPNAPVPNTTSVENDDPVKALLEQERFKHLLSHNGLVYKDGEFQYEDSVVAKGFESFFKGDKEKIQPAMRGFKSILEKELPPDKAMSLLKKHKNLFRAATLQYGRNKDSKHTAEINDFIRELARATASGEAINGDEETEQVETGEQSAVSPEAPAQEASNKKPGILGKILGLGKGLRKRSRALRMWWRWNREAREDEKIGGIRGKKLKYDQRFDPEMTDVTLDPQGDISGIFYSTKKDKDGGTTRLTGKEATARAWDSILVERDEDGNRTVDTEGFADALKGGLLKNIETPRAKIGTKEHDDWLNMVIAPLADDSGARRLRGDQSAFENALSDARGVLQLFEKGYLGASPSYLAKKLKQEGQGGRPEYVRAVTEAFGLTRDSDPGANFVNATMSIRDYLHASPAQRIAELAEQGAASGVMTEIPQKGLHPWRWIKSKFGFPTGKQQMVSLSDEERTKYTQELAVQLLPFTKSETWKVNGKEQERLMYDEEGAEKAYRSGKISPEAMEYVRNHETRGASIVEKYGARRKMESQIGSGKTAQFLGNVKTFTVALAAMTVAVSKLAYNHLKNFATQIENTTRSLAGYNGKLGALEGWRQAREFWRKTRHGEQTAEARIEIAEAMENVKDAWADLVAVFLNSGGGEALAKIAQGFAMLLEKMQPFAEWLGGFVNDIADVPRKEAEKATAEMNGEVEQTGSERAKTAGKWFLEHSGAAGFLISKLFGGAKKKARDIYVENHQEEFPELAEQQQQNAVSEQEAEANPDSTGYNTKPSLKWGFYSGDNTFKENLKNAYSLPIRMMQGAVGIKGEHHYNEVANWNAQAEFSWRNTGDFLKHLQETSSNGAININAVDWDKNQGTEFTRLGIRNAGAVSKIDEAGGIEKVSDAAEFLRDATAGYGSAVKGGTDEAKLLAAIDTLMKVFGQNDSYLAKIKEATEKTAENTDPNKDGKGQIENQAIYKTMMNFARRSSATGGRADEFKNESWSSDSKQYGRWADAGKTYIVGGRR